jgi:hypothetical protein
MGRWNPDIRFCRICMIGLGRLTSSVAHLVSTFGDTVAAKGCPPGLGEVTGLGYAIEPGQFPEGQGRIIREVVSSFLVRSQMLGSCSAGLPGVVV